MTAQANIISNTVARECKAVDAHLTGIRETMGVESTSQLIALFRENGMLARTAGCL
jgi:hypothetical protein